MAHWLDKYPILRVMQKTISADYYNKTRIALSREKLPWQLDIEQIRCLQCVLDEKAWVCFDESQNNYPILAWTDFHIAQRESLDSPVLCELRLYHIHAGLIMGKVLDAIVQAVDEHYQNMENPHYPVTRLEEATKK
jgi:hypothetical protein